MYAVYSIINTTDCAIPRSLYIISDLEIMTVMCLLDIDTHTYLRILLFRTPKLYHRVKSVKGDTVMNLIFHVPENQKFYFENTIVSILITLFCNQFVKHHHNEH